MERYLHLEFLIRGGVPADSRNEDGRSLLFVVLAGAAESETDFHSKENVLWLEIYLVRLIRHGVDIFEVFDDGCSITDYFCGNDFLDVWETALEKAGIDLDYFYEENWRRGQNQVAVTSTHDYTPRVNLVDRVQAISRRRGFMAED